MHQRLATQAQQQPIITAFSMATSFSDVDPDHLSHSMSEACLVCRGKPASSHKAGAEHAPEAGHAGAAAAEAACHGRAPLATAAQISKPVSQPGELCI